MYLRISRQETSDALELIARSRHYPSSVFLQVIAEKELQSLLGDLFAEVEVFLIGYASIGTKVGSNQRLSTSVTSRATMSIVDGSQVRMALPPLI